MSSSYHIEQGFVVFRLTEDVAIISKSTQLKSISARNKFRNNKSIHSVPWIYPEVVHESDVKTDTVVVQSFCINEAVYKETKRHINNLEITLIQ